MTDPRPPRMTMLRLVDEHDDPPPRMTMFRTLGATKDGAAVARGSSPDLRASVAAARPGPSPTTSERHDQPSGGRVEVPRPAFAVQPDRDRETSITEDGDD
ncbi:MAG: hypothetical protein ABI467_15790 [Kofleriaceae bacterium]